MNSYEPHDDQPGFLELKPIYLSSSSAQLSSRSPAHHPSPDRASKKQKKAKDGRRRRRGQTGVSVLLSYFAPNHPEIAARARPGNSDDEHSSPATSSSSEDNDMSVDVDRRSFDTHGPRPASNPPASLPGVYSAAPYSAAPSDYRPQAKWFDGLQQRPQGSFHCRSDTSVAQPADFVAGVRPEYLRNEPVASKLEASRYDPPVAITINPQHTSRQSPSHHPSSLSEHQNSSSATTLPGIGSIFALADRGNVHPHLHRRANSSAGSTASTASGTAGPISITAPASYAGMSSFQLDKYTGQRQQQQLAPFAAQVGGPNPSEATYPRSSNLVSSPALSGNASETSQSYIYSTHVHSSSASNHTTPASSTTENHPSPLVATEAHDYPRTGRDDSKSSAAPSPNASVHSAGGFCCTHPGCTAAPFSTQYLLNSHANVHSDSRPHFCPHEGCPHSEGGSGKGFKRKNEMKRHQLVHASPSYTCPFCPERDHKYPRPDNLQRHVRAHHEGVGQNDPKLREALDSTRRAINASNLGRNELKKKARARIA